METPDPVLSALFKYGGNRHDEDPPPSESKRREFRDFARKKHAELVTDPMTCWYPFTFAVWWHIYLVQIARDPMFARRPWPADWPITPEELLTLREEYWLYYASVGRKDEVPKQWEARAAEARENPTRLTAFVARRLSHLRAFESGIRSDMYDSAATCIGRPLELTLGAGPWTFEHPVYGTFTSDRVADTLARIRCTE